jgi:hypothetical protein
MLEVLFVGAMIAAVGGLIWKMTHSRPELPDDPDAHQPVPVRRGPHDRAGAVALAEPEENEPEDLIGR